MDAANACFDRYNYLYPVRQAVVVNIELERARERAHRAKKKSRFRCTVLAYGN